MSSNANNGVYVASLSVIHSSAISLATVILVCHSVCRPHSYADAPPQYDIMPENFIFMGFYFVLSKCAS